MDNSTSLEDLLSPYTEVIEKFIIENKICNKDEKKDLVWDIFKCVFDSKISINDFQTIVEKCSSSNIEIPEGNMWNHLKNHFHFKDNHIKFLKCIFNKCPRGLSTSPNADCGKGELFYRMLRPNSRQPNKGDIIDGDEKIEIKGSKVRLFGNKSGKQYINETNGLFKNTDIKGNYPKKGDLKGKEQYEIEKTQYGNYYSKQFSLNVNQSKEYIKKYCKLHDIEYEDKDINDMFKRDIWDQSILQKLWLKKMLKITMGESNKMIIFGDGTNVKVLKNTSDLDKVKIYSDYFRINQNNIVGYYIK